MTTITFIYIKRTNEKLSSGKTKPRNFQYETAQSIYIYTLGWLLSEPFLHIQHLYKIYFMPTARKFARTKRKRTISFPNEHIPPCLVKFILFSRLCPSYSLKKKCMIVGNLKGLKDIAPVLSFHNHELQITLFWNQ
jgi:hypothetical protein